MCLPYKASSYVTWYLIRLGTVLPSTSSCQVLLQGEVHAEYPVQGSIIQGVHGSAGPIMGEAKKRSKLFDVSESASERSSLQALDPDSPESRSWIRSGLLPLALLGCDVCALGCSDAIPGDPNLGYFIVGSVREQSSALLDVRYAQGWTSVHRT